ncbi:MAG: pyridoxal phosphate-dependent aminotransferase [Fimbriimonadaceae bacterium]|nr:pyridoxal phosphate-dependent aminotransferase [Fimbriimonadaceae bacterium]
MGVLASRTDLLQPSPTLAMTARARALVAEGHDVVSFAAGEPDFNTPEPVCHAASEAIRKGFTKYTPTTGIPDLKQAVVDKMARENGVTVRPENVVVSCGAKQSLFNAIMTLVDPGDEVIVFAPFWATYSDQIKLAGGTPVVVATRATDDFVPRLEDLTAAITAKTRAILLNSPTNPTGAVYPRETLKEIAATAIRHDLWVIADEIYERLVYGKTHTSLASLGAEIASRTVTVVGVSKSYSMTGWRIGFAVAPVEVAKAMGNLQDQVTSNPTSFAQKGAVVALGLPNETMEGMRGEFEGRRDLVLRKLRAIPDLDVRTPGGAFYVFPDVRPYLGGEIANDSALAEALLERARVATIPGSVFQAPGFLRLSYAASRHDIDRGVDRIAEFLVSLRP